MPKRPKESTQPPAKHNREGPAEDEEAVRRTGAPGSEEPAPPDGEETEAMDTTEKEETGLIVQDPSQENDEEDLLNPLMVDADMLDNELEAPVIELDEREPLGEVPAPVAEAPVPAVPEIPEEAPAAQIPAEFELPVYQDEHPFADFYGHEYTDELPKFPTAKAVAMTTLSQIQRARNETIACITAPDVMIERPNRADATGPSVFRTSLDLTSDLIIAVIVKNMGGYLIASPALREYCADDRGDLFTLLVNEFSYDYLSQTYTKISELHVGDVISVETIFRRQGYTPAQWSPVPLPIDRVRETFFVVGRFAVWKRNETKPQPIVPVGGFLHGHKVPVVLFGSTKQSDHCKLETRHSHGKFQTNRQEVSETNYVVNEADAPLFIDMVRSCSPPHSPSLPLVMLSRVTQRSHTMAPHSDILRPLAEAHNHRARLDTLRSPCTLAHGPDYAKQPAARTIDDRRRPSDVRRLLDTHTLPPTNQDRAADQSALMETFWKDPAHFWHYIRRRFRPFHRKRFVCGPSQSHSISPADMVKERL
uniref:Uncharacterized protein n=1 Tax=Caenorhabditis japonica TaxID=281687 RepID=A0A8R1DVA0_CAEJA